MKKIIYSVLITWVMILSCRVVLIPSPLNIFEQVGLIGIMIDYTVMRSGKLEEKDNEANSKL